MRRDWRTVAALLLVCAFLGSVFLVRPAEAAVSKTSSAASTGSTCILSSVASGELLVAVTYSFTAQPLSVTDNQSNYYAPQVAKSESSATYNAYITLWSTLAQTSSSHVAVSIGVPSAGTYGWSCMAFSGVLSSTAAQETTGGGSYAIGSTSDSVSVGSFTPLAQDLIVAGVILPFCSPPAVGSPTPPFGNIVPGLAMGLSSTCSDPAYYQGQLGDSDYLTSATGSATTVPWSWNWSAFGTSLSASANWAEVAADFTVATFTTTATTTITSTATTTTCTSVVTTTKSTTTTTTVITVVTVG